jgi:hypothetical protein
MMRGGEFPNLPIPLRRQSASWKLAATTVQKDKEA